MDCWLAAVSSVAARICTMCGSCAVTYSQGLISDERVCLSVTVCRVVSPLRTQDRSLCIDLALHAPCLDDWLPLLMTCCLQPLSCKIERCQGTWKTLLPAVCADGYGGGAAETCSQCAVDSVGQGLHVSSPCVQCPAHSAPNADHTSCGK